jgi:hypothetical protein
MIGAVREIARKAGRNLSTVLEYHYTVERVQLSTVRTILLVAEYWYAQRSLYSTVVVLYCTTVLLY